jgi:Domain of unknown function (DUF4397)
MSIRMKVLVSALVTLVFATVAPGAFAAAKVRVLHSAPDVPAVDVYVNGDRAVTGLAPLAATGYLELPAGKYDVAIRVAGSPALSAPALATSITVEDGKSYTGYATGFLGDGSVRLGVLQDSSQAPFSQAALRVWHNSPDAPNVDVLVNGQPVLTNVRFGTSSAYLTVPAGSYEVDVNVTGTSTSVFSGTLELERGQAYTAVALGSAGQPAKGEPFEVNVLEDATSGALVKVLHASPNVPPVTVYVNGEVAFERIRTLTGTKYISLPAGTYEVAVALEGDPVSEAVLTTKLTVADKTRYVAFARGLLEGSGAAKLELAAQTSIAVAPEGKAALRVWHLSPDAPRVDIYVNGNKTLSRIPYKAASAYLTLDPGTYAVQVNVAGTDTVVAKKRVTVKAGRAYSAVALGSVGGTGSKFRIGLIHDA